LIEEKKYFIFIERDQHTQENTPTRRPIQAGTDGSQLDVSIGKTHRREHELRTKKNISEEKIEENNRKTNTEASTSCRHQSRL
jgi:hypothetical protein